MLVEVIFPALADVEESVLIGAGPTKLTSEATPRQVTLATLQVEAVGLHNKTLVNPVALQCTRDSPTSSSL